MLWTFFATKELIENDLSSYKILDLSVSPWKNQQDFLIHLNQLKWCISAHASAKWMLNANLTKVIFFKNSFPLWICSKTLNKKLSSLHHNRPCYNKSELCFHLKESSSALRKFLFFWGLSFMPVWNTSRMSQTDTYLEPYLISMMGIFGKKVNS